MGIFVEEIYEKMVMKRIHSIKVNKKKGERRREREEIEIALA